MLIRSQDKTELWNMNLIINVKIEQSFTLKNYYCVIAQYETNEEYVLGRYSSELKAFNVLDRIEEYYKNTLKYKVFQLPQDDEM